MVFFDNGAIELIPRLAAAPQFDIELRFRATQQDWKGLVTIIAKGPEGNLRGRRRASIRRINSGDIFQVRTKDFTSHPLHNQLLFSVNRLMWSMVSSAGLYEAKTSSMLLGGRESEAMDAAGHAGRDVVTSDGFGVRESSEESADESEYDELDDHWEEERCWGNEGG